MKRFFICLLLLVSTISFGQQEAFVIYNSKGKKSSFKKLVKATQEKSFIFFGEYHNNPICHWLQLELTKELYSRHKKDLVLGAEMFEADNQFIINEYLRDLISSTNFQDEVRLWPNYNTDYKPLLEFARENKLPFVATNIPRRYANMVYKKGLESLNDLSDLAKGYIVPLASFEFDSTVKCYRDMITSMGDHGSTDIAKAQAIKDATMSHFILRNSTSTSVFLHYNGAYHSDNYQGIVHYLKKSVESESILTISTVSQDNVSNLHSKYKGQADFIICVPENMTSTH